MGTEVEESDKGKLDRIFPIRSMVKKIKVPEVEDFDEGSIDNIIPIR